MHPFGAGHQLSAQPAGYQAIAVDNAVSVGMDNLRVSSSSRVWSSSSSSKF